MEWRRVDLHVHTRGSKDYQEPDATYLDILRKAEAEGLDIIAFTDHNTVAGYAAMMQEITDLERWEASKRLQPQEKARLEEYRRLRSKVLVLPGFELTATFGFHILGIFDPSTPTRSIEHTLLRLNVPLESLEVGETEVGATDDVLTAYRTIAEAGGLVIAAHANSSHGVAMFGFDFGGQTKIAYTQDPNLHALEVTDLEVTRRRTTASFFNGSKPEYPRRMHCIQGSDSHRVTGIPGSRQHFGVGERATEVLLPEVSFHALKEVFLGNDFARTRPYRHAAEPLDPVEEARKEGATIVQSFHERATRAGGRMHAVLRDVVAFANGNGGTIYLGVSLGSRGQVVGVDSPEETIKELRAEIQHMITPPIDVNMTVTPSQGKNVVRVIVPKGTEIPYVLEGSKIYLRQEGETSLAMRDEIVALIQRALSEAQPAAAAPKAAQPERQAQRPSRRGRGRGAQRAAAAPPAGQPAAAETTPSTPEPARQPMVALAEAEVSDEEEAGSEGELLAVSAEPAVNGDTPSDRPRTGVEIVATEERDGVMYHTMRDLRDGRDVHNVTRNSARRLWRYAIALKEKHTFQPEKVAWQGEYGLWHRYLRAGKPQYDLVQKGPEGQLHVYYGVTEDGVHGPWKALVGSEE